MNESVLGRYLYFLYLLETGKGVGRTSKRSCTVDRTQINCTEQSDGRRFDLPYPYIDRGTYYCSVR